MKLKAYTPQEVSEILQVNVNTIYELIDKGEIPAKRFGRLIRISPVVMSFLTTGLDNDILEATKNDLESLNYLEDILGDIRKK